MNNVIVGLTGQFGSGCSTVAEFLEKELSFKRYSFSDILKPALKDRLGSEAYRKLSHKELRRELQNQGNLLRESNSAMIANTIMKRIGEVGQNNTDIVIEAFRNPSEVNVFRDNFTNFFLISLDADQEERFTRKKEYTDDLERFKQDDLRDKGDYEPLYGQQTEDCVFSADISVDNNEHRNNVTEFDVLFKGIRDYVTLMKKPGWRQPSYSELYMRQAYTSRLRSRCAKRQVGAVIVCEGSESESAYLIASGWNDPPTGLAPCSDTNPSHEYDQRYCPKDDKLVKILCEMQFCPKCGKEIPSLKEHIKNYQCANCKALLPTDFIPGRSLDVCRAVHAEEAAILQAARLGSTSLENATLYTTTFPCLLCAKSIVNSGIKKVVYREPYPMEDAKTVLKSCEIKLEKYQGVNPISFDRMFTGMLDS